MSVLSSIIAEEYLDPHIATISSFISSLSFKYRSPDIPGSNEFFSQINVNTLLPTHFWHRIQILRSLFPDLVDSSFPKQAAESHLATNTVYQHHHAFNCHESMQSILSLILGIPSLRRLDWNRDPRLILSPQDPTQLKGGSTSLFTSRYPSVYHFLSDLPYQQSEDISLKRNESLFSYLFGGKSGSNHENTPKPSIANSSITAEYNHMEIALLQTYSETSRQLHSNLTKLFPRLLFQPTITHHPQLIAYQIFSVLTQLLLITHQYTVINTYFTTPFELSSAIPSLTFHANISPKTGLKHVYDAISSSVAARQRVGAPTPGTSGETIPHNASNDDKSTISSSTQNQSLEMIPFQSYSSLYTTLTQHLDILLSFFVSLVPRVACSPSPLLLLPFDPEIIFGVASMQHMGVIPSLLICAYHAIINAKFGDLAYLQHYLTSLTSTIDTNTLLSSSTNEISVYEGDSSAFAQRGPGDCPPIELTLAQCLIYNNYTTAPFVFRYHISITYHSSYIYHHQSLSPFSLDENSAVRELPRTLIQIAVIPIIHEPVSKSAHESINSNRSGSSMDSQSKDICSPDASTSHMTPAVEHLSMAYGDTYVYGQCLVLQIFVDAIPTDHTMLHDERCDDDETCIIRDVNQPGISPNVYSDSSDGIHQLEPPTSMDDVNITPPNSQDKKQQMITIHQRGVHLAMVLSPLLNTTAESIPTIIRNVLTPEKTVSAAMPAGTHQHGLAPKHETPVLSSQTLHAKSEHSTHIKTEPTLMKPQPLKEEPAQAQAHHAPRATLSLSSHKPSTVRPIRQLYNRQPLRPPPTVKPTLSLTRPTIFSSASSVTESDHDNDDDDDNFNLLPTLSTGSSLNLSKLRRVTTSTTTIPQPRLSTPQVTPIAPPKRRARKQLDDSSSPSNSPSDDETNEPTDENNGDSDGEEEESSTTTVQVQTRKRPRRNQPLPPPPPPPRMFGGLQLIPLKNGARPDLFSSLQPQQEPSISESAPKQQLDVKPETIKSTSTQQILPAIDETPRSLSQTRTAAPPPKHTMQNARASHPRILHNRSARLHHFIQTLSLMSPSITIDFSHHSPRSSFTFITPQVATLQSYIPPTPTIIPNYGYIPHEYLASMILGSSVHSIDGFFHREIGILDTIPLMPKFHPLLDAIARICSSQASVPSPTAMSKDLSKPSQRGDDTEDDSDIVAMPIHHSDDDDDLTSPVAPDLPSADSTQQLNASQQQPLRDPTLPILSTIDYPTPRHYNNLSLAEQKQIVHAIAAKLIISSILRMIPFTLDTLLTYSTAPGGGDYDKMTPSQPLNPPKVADTPPSTLVPLQGNTGGATSALKQRLASRAAAISAPSEQQTPPTATGSTTHRERIPLSNEQRLLKQSGINAALPATLDQLACVGIFPMDVPLDNSHTTTSQVVRVEHVAIEEFRANLVYMYALWEAICLHFRPTPHTVSIASPLEHDRSQLGSSDPLELYVDGLLGIHYSKKESPDTRLSISPHWWTSNPMIAATDSALTNSSTELLHQYVSLSAQLKNYKLLYVRCSRSFDYVQYAHLTIDVAIAVMYIPSHQVVSSSSSQEITQGRNQSRHILPPQFDILINTQPVFTTNNDLHLDIPATREIIHQLSTLLTPLALPSRCFFHTIISLSCIHPSMLLTVPKNTLQKVHQNHMIETLLQQQRSVLQSIQATSPPHGNLAINPRHITIPYLGYDFQTRLQHIAGDDPDGLFEDTPVTDVIQTDNIHDVGQPPKLSPLAQIVQPFTWYHPFLLTSFFPAPSISHLNAKTLTLMLTALESCIQLYLPTLPDPWYEYHKIDYASEGITIPKPPQATKQASTSTLSQYGIAPSMGNNDKTNPDIFSTPVKDRSSSSNKSQSDHDHTNSPSTAATPTPLRRSARKHSATKKVSYSQSDDDSDTEMNVRLNSHQLPSTSAQIPFHPEFFRGLGNDKVQAPIPDWQPISRNRMSDTSIHDALQKITEPPPVTSKPTTGRSSSHPKNGATDPKFKLVFGTNFVLKIPNPSLTSHHTSGGSTSATSETSTQPHSKSQTLKPAIQSDSGSDTESSDASFPFSSIKTLIKTNSAVKGGVSSPAKTKKNQHAGKHTKGNASPSPVKNTPRTRKRR